MQDPAGFDLANDKVTETEPGDGAEQDGRASSTTGDTGGVGQKPTPRVILFCVVLMILVQFDIAFFPILIKINGINKGLDLSFLTFCRTLFPTLSLMIPAFCIEGNIPTRHTKRDCLTYFILGVIGCCYYPFVANYIPIITNASFTLIVFQLQPIFNTIFSYLFKLEEFPNWQNIYSISILFGILACVLFSFVLVLLSFNGIKTSSAYYDWFIASILGVVSLISYAFYLSYQLLRYVNNEESAFYKKPLSFLAVIHFISGVILIVPVSVWCLINWKDVMKCVESPEAWVTLSYSMAINGVFNSVAIAYCNYKTSPMLVGLTYTLQIIIGLALAAIILNETLSSFQYVLCLGIIMGFSAVMIAKMKAKNTYKHN